MSWAWDVEHYSRDNLPYMDYLYLVFDEGSWMSGLSLNSRGQLEFQCRGGAWPGAVRWLGCPKPKTKVSVKGSSVIPTSPCLGIFEVYNEVHDLSLLEVRSSEAGQSTKDKVRIRSRLLECLRTLLDLADQGITLDGNAVPAGQVAQRRPLTHLSTRAHSLSVIRLCFRSLIAVIKLGVDI